MIAETEQYWDSIIQGMEDYKSRWQELGEIEEQAKLTATLEQLGISTNDPGKPLPDSKKNISVFLRISIPATIRCSPVSPTQPE